MKFLDFFRAMCKGLRIHKALRIRASHFRGRHAYRPALELLEDRLAPSVSPLHVSANGRYLVDGNNTPFLIKGDAAWELVISTTQAEADQFLTARANQGFNLVMVNLIDHMFGPNAPANMAGAYPFLNVSTGQHRAFIDPPNESYFAYADWVINDATQKGMYVLLDPSYLGFGGGSEGFYEDMVAAGPTAMRQWGEYVGNRYQNFTNIIWLEGGDYNPPANGLALVNEVALGIQEFSSNIQSAHTARGSSAQDIWGAYSWLTLNSTYTSTLTYDRSLVDYNRTLVSPSFLVEDVYENEHSITNQQARAEKYWSLLSGSTGTIMGNDPIWGFDYHLDFATLGPWQNWLDSQLAKDMSRLGNLFTSRAWYNLVPDQNHTVVTAGFGSFGQADYVTGARTGDGTLVMAYVPSSRTLTVNMSKLSGTVTARWFDPTNGIFTMVSGSPFANAGSRTFTTPGNNSTGNGDWVLVLDAPPAAPTNLTATAGNSQVSLSWSASGGASTYQIFRATSSGGETLVQSGVTATTFTDTGLTNGTTYYYKVAAIGPGGSSSLSNEASITPDGPPTVAADNPSVSALENVAATNTGTFSDFDDPVTVTADVGTVTQSGSQSGTWSWSGTGDDDTPYTVTITATNAADSTSSTTSFSVSFTDVAPTVAADLATVSAPESEPATNTGTFEDYDDAVSITADVGAVTQSGSQSGTWTWSGTGDDDTPYTVTITATNADGSLATTTFEVSFTDVAPIVAADNPSVTAPEFTTVGNTGTFADVNDAVIITANVGTVTQAGSQSGTWSWIGTAPDESTPYTVTITATNADGSITTTSFEVDATEMAPSVTADNADVTAANGSATNTGTFSDVDDAVTISVSGGGSVTQSGSQSGTWSWSDSDIDVGDHTITIKASNADGSVTTISFVVHCNNHPPGAVITGAPASSPEGTAITISGVTSTDPDAGDSITNYAWNVTKGGAAYASQSGASATFSFTPNDNGSYVVTLVATDRHGATSSTANKTIAATNVCPAVTETGPSAGVSGENLVFTGNFGDVSTVDEAAGLSYTWTVKLGSTTVASGGPAIATGPGATSFGFTATTTGSFSVRLQVTDKNGGSTTYSKAVTISTAVATTDPADPTKTALLVGGTTGNDTIVIQRISTTGSYSATINAVNVGSFHPTGHIYVFGGDGNDTISLVRNSFGFVSMPAQLFGQAGNDNLDGSGSTANNILIGGDGNDTLTAGSVGYSILIGGVGTDTLNNNSLGNAGNLMIGDWTDYDSNIAALNALMAEWGRADETLAQKITNLRNGTGNTGGNRLTAGTVHDDGVADNFSFDVLKDWWIDGGSSNH